MISFLDSFLPFVGATWVPGLLGLILIVWAGIVFKSRYLAAFAVGIFLWFIVDTIEGSGSLDVSAGFGGGIDQVGKVVLFMVGVLGFFAFDRARSIFAPGLAVGKYGMVIPGLTAIALGIHGIGEGASFGGTAALIGSTSLTEAFGGLTGGVAYVLHKMLEPMMIGACYRVYSWENAKSVFHRLRDLVVLSLVFALPSLLGAATGYYLTYNSSYLFALGTGTAIYAAARLFGPLYSSTQPPSARDTIFIAGAIMLGLLSLYFAGLFHSE